jgi:hypothetical protein
VVDATGAIGKRTAAASGALALTHRGGPPVFRPRHVIHATRRISRWSLSTARPDSPRELPGSGRNQMARRDRLQCPSPRQGPATRKPLLLFSFVGLLLLRFDDCRLLSLLFHVPPRSPRFPQPFHCPGNPSPIAYRPSTRRRKPKLCAWLACANPLEIGDF